MIGILISFSIATIASIIFVVIIHNDDSTQEERDNTPFP